MQIPLSITDTKFVKLQNGIFYKIAQKIISFFI